MIPETFLSASVPEPREGRSPAFAERVPPDVSRHVGSAVTHLAARVIELGGRLVFGGHPSITPRITQVAADLGLSRRTFDAPPIVVYQSELYDDLLVDEAKMLRAAPYVEYVTTKARASFDEVEASAWGSRAGEAERLADRIDTLRADHAPSEEPRVRRDASLLEMRLRMLERSALGTMVAIGGYDGVLYEASLFLRGGPNRRVRLLHTTGGASRLLAETFPHERLLMPAVDGPFLSELAGAEDLEGYRPLVAEAPLASDPLEGLRLAKTPYGLIMDLLAREAGRPFPGPITKPPF